MIKRYEIRLELAINADFPRGNNACGFVWKLPLTADFQIDASAWVKDPKSFQVSRFWESEQDVQGHMVQRSEGVWYMEYSDGEQEPVFQLDNEKLLPGEFIDIRDHGNLMHIFKVVSITAIESELPGIDLNYRAPADAESDADYYEVKLAIQDTDYQAFLGSEYTFTLALTEDGHIDLAEWERDSSNWQAAYSNPSGKSRLGDFVASGHIWYVHFKGEEESYELIKQMEQQDLRVQSEDVSPVMIRDCSGHWHSYKVTSCSPLKPDGD